MAALGFLALTVLSAGVLGHGGATNYTVGDTWYAGYDPYTPEADQITQPWLVQRAWNSIDPVWSVDDPALACNTPGTAPRGYIPIRAGSNLTAVYWYWLHSHGPMTVWLAACGADCSTVNVNQVNWFKIWEAGLLSGNQETGIWYQKDFQRFDGSPGLWPATIPRTLRRGLYLVRHEIISTHVAYKPQFYVECAHLNITGTGFSFPSNQYMKKFPGAYVATDPSLDIDVYIQPNPTTYAIPGGPVWRG